MACRSGSRAIRIWSAPISRWRSSRRPPARCPMRHCTGVSVDTSLMDQIDDDDEEAEEARPTKMRRPCRTGNGDDGRGKRQAQEAPAPSRRRRRQQRRRPRPTVRTATAPADAAEAATATGTVQPDAVTATTSRRSRGGRCAGRGPADNGRRCGTPQPQARKPDAHTPDPKQGGRDHRVRGGHQRRSQRRGRGAAPVAAEKPEAKPRSRRTKPKAEAPMRPPKMRSARRPSQAAEAAAEAKPKPKSQKTQRRPRQKADAAPAPQPEAEHAAPEPHPARSGRRLRPNRPQNQRPNRCRNLLDRLRRTNRPSQNAKAGGRWAAK